MLDAVGDVVLHVARSPFGITGIQKGFAIAGRSSEIGLKDGISAIRHELREGVIAPDISRPRSAVWPDDQGEIFLRDAFWEREICRDFQSVSCGIPNALHLGEVLGW